MITLLLFSFILTFFLIKGIVSFPNKNRDVLIVTVLYFSLVLALITEILSFCGRLDYLSLSLFWSGFSMIGIYIIIRRHQKTVTNLISLVRQFSYYTKNVTKFNRLALIVLIFFLVGIFIQAIVYPPNTFDSMTYHMARVSHWVNNSSVNHFPTHIYRQLYQPPLAEFFITHIVILQKSDLYANFVQFFFLIFSLVTISLITEQLGLSKKMQIAAVIFALLTPEIILQGSSTQNDIVVSFFVLSCIYYVIKVIQTKQLFSIIMIGISAGLALLTKGTAYIYIFPLILMLAVCYVYSIFNTKKYLILSHGIIVIVIITFINMGHYYRNYSLTGNLLGITENMQNRYSNEDITLSAIGSNIIRNIALHFGPYPLSNISEKAVIKIHSLLNLDVSDSRYTFGRTKFKVPKRPSHESFAPNILQMTLSIFALVLGGIYFLRKVKKSNKILIFLYLALILQSILFCSYLKWQPWHTRLHTPLFFLISPLIIFIYSTYDKRIISVILFLCFLYGIPILLFNSSRPFITLPPVTQEINIFDSREKKYFANRLSLYEDYSKINFYISEKNYTNIGLILSGDSFEYPLINKFDKPRPLVFNHINLGENNPSRNIITPKKDIDIIISNRKDQFITFNNELFIRKTDGNKLFLYEKKLTPIEF